ncbi:MAG: NAD(P)H-binding protein [Tabrizicola sp.]|nr:NAD(P)H-binding protein [Tabrizicola sp.]
MNLALFGATGPSGKAVLAEAQRRGHQVTVLARDPARVSLEQGKVRVVRGDARDPAAVAETLRGADAVVQTLGVGGLGTGKPDDLVPVATRLILDAMRAQGIRRIVCASNIGVPGSGAYFTRFVLVPLIARKLIPIIASKVEMETILRQSDADWTAVRLAALTEKPAKGRLKVSETGKGPGMFLTTADAASFVLDIIENRQFLRQAVAIAN